MEREETALGEFATAVTQGRLLRWLSANELDLADAGRENWFELVPIGPRPGGPQGGAPARGRNNLQERLCGAPL